MSTFPAYKQTSRTPPPHTRCGRPHGKPPPRTSYLLPNASDTRASTPLLPPAPLLPLTHCFHQQRRQQCRATPRRTSPRRQLLKARAVCLFSLTPRLSPAVLTLQPSPAHTGETAPSPGRPLATRYAAHARCPVRTRAGPSFPRPPHVSASQGSGGAAAAAAAQAAAARALSQT